MRILVTGSAGFIGHHLVRFLRDKGHQVFEADMESDLTLPHNALEMTEGVEWVFNLAALNGSIEFTTNNKAELIHNNALVNLNMAEARWKNGVDRVLFTSSACVYPMSLQEGIHALKESDVSPAEPDTEYGWEKLFSEHVWQSYAQDRGLDVRIARLINVYGTEGSLDPLMSKAPIALSKKVIDSDVVEIWGDGEQKRTFCHVNDILDGLLLLMESDCTEPVNLGSDELISINELVDLIAKIEGKQVTKLHDLDRVQGVRNRLPDISKIKGLGWQPKVSLEDGLREVNQWIKSL